MTGTAVSRARRYGWVLTPVLVWLAVPGRFALWPLLSVALVPLLTALGCLHRPRQAALCGLGAGTLLYALQIYWIVPVLVTYGGLSWAVAVPAMLLLVLYMSLYLALFSVGFVLLDRTRAAGLLLPGAAALWVGLDWVRGWLFTGFPWLDLGYAYASLPAVLQVVDLFGHYGLTFCTVLVNILLYMCLATGYTGRQRIRALAATAVLIASLSGYAALRFGQVERLVAAAQTPVMGIAQANVDQARKWSPAEREATVAGYIRLSEDLAAEHRATLVVWPETALPFYPRDPGQIRPLVEFVRKTGVSVLTGSPWFEIYEDRATRKVSYYNGALLMPPSGRFEGFYYKSHLVPYGEYVPLREFMPFLSPLVEAVGDFTPGVVGEPLANGDIRAGVLICFESIFERIGRAWVEQGANVLVNLTNDAWYGKSSAPYQSWAMTVYRAVETRRSVVRSANTGISGVIDPLGRVIMRSDIFVEWTGAAAVPLLTTTTFFVRAGYLFAPACAMIALGIAFMVWKRAQRTGRSVL